MDEIQNAIADMAEIILRGLELYLVPIFIGKPYSEISGVLD